MGNNPNLNLTRAEVDQVRQWLYSDINLKGHRIQNAGKSVNTGDYITRGESIAGTNIVNINANNITSGTLANARLGIQKASWVPTQAGVVLTVNSAKYWNLETVTFFQFDLTWPVTADTTVISIAGLPLSGTVQCAAAIGFDGSGVLATALVQTTPRIVLYKATHVQAQNVDLTGARIVVSGMYT